MKSFNYLALFLVISLGVCTGNLLSNYITTQYAAYQLLRATEAISSRLSAQRQQQNEAAREQRSNDLHGRALARSCQEWQQMHQQRPSETTEKESRRQCALYARYVSEGR